MLFIYHLESNVLASIDYRDLEFMNQLGEGGFGTVYRGRWKSRDKVVAIKRLNIIDEREVNTFARKICLCTWG